MTVTNILPLFVDLYRSNVGVNYCFVYFIDLYRFKSIEAIFL
jgi:hypothetical protein